MNFTANIAIEILIIAALIFGLKLFKKPGAAKWGNYCAAAALAGGMALVFVNNGTLSPALVVAAMLLGSAFGVAAAFKVNMIQIPAMVAFQHGAGGAAAFLVSFVELSRQGVQVTALAEASGALGLVIGAATFGGSMIAAGKLGGKMKQTPTILPLHGLWLIALIALNALFFALCFIADRSALPIILTALIVFSAVFGSLFAIRIGGADMPVLISFLNATAGLAAAFCGVAIGNRLLISCGATVAASGSILTHIMCKAMNRGLFDVLLQVGAKIAKPQPSEAKSAAAASVSQTPSSSPVETPTPKAPVKASDPLADAREALSAAKRVIFIPGYGMALAQAQFEVKRLSDSLEKAGKEVFFAIHPVAGRMPGHMNVLLAEADIDYEKLIEMDDANPKFKETDVAIIVGACDVVNPAAIEIEGTPISGMPILLAHESKRAIVCNLDERPGYSGVQNSLYSSPNAILLFGDAKESVAKLI